MAVEAYLKTKNFCLTVHEMVSYKNPLILNDDSQYEKWVKEVKLWQTVTPLKDNEQAPAIALSLSGRARDAALELDITSLNSETGVKQLLEKLDGLYLKDENQWAYIAYQRFEKFQRQPNMSINN